MIAPFWRAQTTYRFLAPFFLAAFAAFFAMVACPPLRLGFALRASCSRVSSRLQGSLPCCITPASREFGIKNEGVPSEPDTPGPVDGFYRFLPPFFFAPAFAVFFAILPPWGTGSSASVYRFRGAATGGLSDPPSYKM